MRSPRTWTRSCARGTGRADRDLLWHLWLHELRGARRSPAASTHGIGSPNLYTSITIDQPAKVYLGHGWAPGSAARSRSHSRTWSMMIGNNPLTSHYAWQGSVPPFSPSRRLRDAKARGLKLICVDPRRTMVAQLADIHLQVRPGEDATLMAALLRVILDGEAARPGVLCAARGGTGGVAGGAGAGFTPEYAAHRADVPVADLVAAARLFARGPRGVATTGTGAEMSRQRHPHRAPGDRAEHRVRALLPRRRGGALSARAERGRRRARRRCWRRSRCGARASRPRASAASRSWAARDALRHGGR